MTDTRGPRSRGEGPPRRQGRGGEGGRPGPPRGGAGRPAVGGASASAEELLEMADELEAHARDLLSQARRLQRIARGLETTGPGRSAASGAPRARTSRGPAQKKPERPGSGGEKRSEASPRRGGRDERAPDWAPPQPRRRRS